MRLFPGRMATQRGFTLLEVVLSISILLTVSVAATQMIKTSINMREGISAKAKINHRMTVAMQKVVNDLTHAYIISTVRAEFKPEARATKTTFKTKRGNGDNTELALTTTTHRALLANSYESDQTYVVYRLQEDQNNRDVVNLMRGETKVLPQSFNEDPPMTMLARNIKSFKVWPWTGEAWEKERWDTDRSEHRNMLPQMVMVEIEAYDDDPEEGDRVDGKERPTVKMSSVVYLPRAYGMKEPKERPKTIKWY